MLKSIRRYLQSEYEIPEVIVEEGNMSFSHLATAPLGERSTDQVDLPPPARESEKVAAISEIDNSTASHADQGLFGQVITWAGNDPKRWGLLNRALLRIYAPRWERVDARDVLVAWTNAWVAITRAKQRLERLQSLKRHLTWSERNERGGREADISFWGRLTKRLGGQIPAALTQDKVAARLLTRLCSRSNKDEQ